jgi:CheY-like chemotaxis protein
MGEDLVRPGRYVVVAVTDDGTGMSEQVQHRLFEPFFTTKEPGKGTGLGLATVHGVVRQSGGYVRVYSELGSGTTFRIYLPAVAQEKAAAAASAHSAPPPRGTETVLLVEDEDAVRTMTRIVLERFGYQVVDAANPREAERIFFQDPARFDLVVSDVIMPESSGPALFKHLVRHRPDLKVLYVSGYTDDTIAHQGQLDPGVTFLQKPYTMAALARRVREVLDQ